ncbi:hypothetical protein [Curtobacterium sp. MCSS17_008]|uniref:hypothetical protein n=1 Tax=Curtobacterium sp. MCSS17_008 TaxID=2175647 RepID=UPI000DA7BFFA|nr:hypothetical protein [Curtobacterium sp. MCSS17_008]
MTAEGTAAGHRWALAQERAEAVLAVAESTDRQRSMGAVAWVLGGSAAAVAVLVALGLTLPPEAPARWAVSVSVAVGAVVLLIVQVVRGAVARRRDGLAPAPVVALLQTRERHAVRQAFHGRRAVPDDRRVVVDAAAVQAASGAELGSLCVTAVLWASAAAAGGTLWPMYVALALVNTAAIVVPALDTLAARRWLSQHPAAGEQAGDVETVRPDVGS